MESNAAAERFERYARHFLREVYPNLVKSNLFVSAYCGDGPPNVKACTELGAAIMLNKPIVIFVADGCTCPPGLERVAHAIVHSEDELRETLDRLLKE